MRSSAFDGYKDQINDGLAQLGSDWKNFGDYLGDGVFLIVPSVPLLLAIIKNMMQNIDNRLVVTSMVLLSNRQLLINFDMSGTGNH